MKKPILILLTLALLFSACFALAEEAVQAAVKDYYDKNGIEYDPNLFRPTHNCETCEG